MVLEAPVSFILTEEPAHSGRLDGDPSVYNEALLIPENIMFRRVMGYGHPVFVVVL